jgi:hypothetical protein
VRTYIGSGEGKSTRAPGCDSGEWDELTRFLCFGRLKRITGVIIHCMTMHGAVGKLGFRKSFGTDFAGEFNTRGWGREICMGFVVGQIHMSRFGQKIRNAQS